MELFKKIFTFQEKTFQTQKTRKLTQKKFIVFQKMELANPKQKPLIFRRKLAKPEKQKILIFP